MEFLIPPLLTSISHLMCSSYVTALSNLKESSVLYMALIANAGTGKSPALSIVKAALNDIEIFLKVKDEESKVLNGMIYISFNNYKLFKRN